jgi:hypothetical protein
MTTFLLILIVTATLIFLANIIRIPSRYGRAYQRGRQVAEAHPNLEWRDLTDVQNMHEYYFPDDKSINGFWDGYKGLEYNEEGYDPDQDQEEESETIEEHLSFWQKMNKK